MEVIMDGTTDLIMGVISEGFIIVAVCFAIGQIIKTSKIKALDKIPNENIPLITAIVGMALSLVPDIFPSDTLITGLIKGAISGWAATGCFEFYRTYKKKSGKSNCDITEEEYEE